MYYEYRDVDPRVRGFIEDVIRPNVLDIRDELADEFDVEDPESDSFGYNSLCIEATHRFIKRMKKYRKQNGLSKAALNIKRIHGEQRPHPRLKMIHWATEHEWAVVMYFGIDIYVDVTCGQFTDFYRDIPEYYISTKPPVWFLPDSENDALCRPWNRKERVMGFVYDRIGWLFRMQVPEEGYR